MLIILRHDDSDDGGEEQVLERPKSPGSRDFQGWGSVELVSLKVNLFINESCFVSCVVNLQATGKGLQSNREFSF